MEETQSQNCESLAQGPNVSGRVGKRSKLCLISPILQVAHLRFRDISGLLNSRNWCMYCNFQLDRLRGNNIAIHFYTRTLKVWDVAFHKLMSKSVEMDFVYWVQIQLSLSLAYLPPFTWISRAFILIIAIETSRCKP